MKNTVLLLVAVATFITVQNASAHRGGYDSNGGHFNRETGEYHCHTKQCNANHKSSSNAFEEAKKEQRQFTTLYDRGEWPHWSDYDKDCQNTRAEVLIEHSKAPITYSRDHCYVKTGKWYDPYTDKVWTMASEVDIDHIVPLKWAHGHGGSHWDTNKKEQFANDLGNLLPVSKVVNRTIKVAKGPDEWLPSNQPYRCTYIQRFDSVVERYGLQYTPSEKRTVDRMKQACGSGKSDRVKR